MEKGYYISKEWGLSSLERKGSISSATLSMSATERLERTGSGGPNGLFQYSSLYNFVAMLLWLHTWYLIIWMSLDF